MDSIGGFHEVETDGKLSQLVYHQPKYQPISQTQTPTSLNNLPFQPLFLCPLLRVAKGRDEQGHSDSLTFPLSHSAECVVSTTSDHPYENQSALSLFWCNNKQIDVEGGCKICSGSNFGTDYYFCEVCDKSFHRECIQSPLKIKHPYHLEHFLKLFYRPYIALPLKCLCCGRRAANLVYYCTICDVVMHTVCAMKTITIGGFHKVENDGKLSQLVYHHPKYQPIPKTQSSTCSNEVANHDHTFQPLFFCPYRRQKKAYSDSEICLLSHSPEYDVSTTRSDHSVLPLFWVNNKEFGFAGGCNVCSGSNFGTDYYFCEVCDKTYHRECVQSPFILKHHYHPEHFLQASYVFPSTPDIECFCCGRGAVGLVYYCTRCNVAMHTICAMKSIPFVVDQPKRHNHPLTLFPKHASLTCNVCGLIRNGNPTYVCLKCSFVAHNDCMYSPRIIKISRHHHRISYTSSLQTEEWSCGVCRKSIDGDYGAYFCGNCDCYVVHVRCALRKDVWDGVELEGVPKEDDITQDAKPYKMISEGVILHFLHGHHLRLEVDIHYNEEKLCEACVMPISEGNFYSCMVCEFILHKLCADSPRRIQHPLHPHPLTLKIGCRYDTNYFRCDACDRACAGFVYKCRIGECEFNLDIRCASISEPFDFKGHEHSVFLALHPDVTPVCEVCKLECYKQFNCIKCDFIVCIKCATLPYKARYKHDKHLLTLLWGTEVCEKDWCEVCERNLQDTSTKLFYWCNDCCTTLHIACLFDDDLYAKPGQILKVRGKEVKVIAKRNLSRPLCDFCKYPCQGRIFTTDNYKACSIKCARGIVVLFNH